MHTAAPHPSSSATFRGRGVLRVLKGILAGTLSFEVLVHASASLAQGIVGTLTDLPNVGFKDLWQVSYQVSGKAFSAGEGFTIYFPATHYSDLALQSGPTGWDVLTIQPNPYVGTVEFPGFLDALALVDDPPLSDPFVIRFHWMGGGVPGPQDFQTYSLAGSFQITGTGNVAVPEGTAWNWIPLPMGLLFLARRLSHKRRPVPASRSRSTHPAPQGN